MAEEFKPDFNDAFEAVCTDAEGASEALQQGYALLEEVGDDLRPAARRRLEAAVNKLEAAMAAFEEDPWAPRVRVRVVLTQK